jgi:hypothetical protein
MAQKYEWCVRILLFLILEHFKSPELPLTVADRLLLIWSSKRSACLERLPVSVLRVMSDLYSYNSSRASKLCVRINSTSQSPGSPNGSHQEDAEQLPLVSKESNP